MKNQRLLERKQELKQLAKEIRELKAQRKTARYGYVSGLEYDRHQCRLKHIAYCLARGRKYEEIEKKTHEPLCSYQWEKINKDIEYLQEGFDEDVRVSA